MLNKRYSKLLNDMQYQQWIYLNIYLYTFTYTFLVVLSILLCIYGKIIL